MYTNPLSKAIRVSGLANKPLYPVQIYESLGCFSIGLIVFTISYFYHILGLLTGVYVFLYGILRFTCEFYRGEADTEFVKGLSVYQWISLIFILAGMGLSIYALQNGVHGHIGFHVKTLLELADFLPYLVFVPFIILFFYGFHYKKIGKWC